MVRFRPLRRSGICVRLRFKCRPVADGDALHHSYYYGYILDTDSFAHGTLFNHRRVNISFLVSMRYSFSALSSYLCTKVLSLSI